MVDAVGDLLETLRTVVHGVHAGLGMEEEWGAYNVGEEGLGGADVGGGLVSADVLLTGLESETDTGVALGVLGDGDDSAGHLTDVLLLDGHETGGGTSVAHGVTESLGGTDADIGVELAGGLDDGEGEEI